MAKSVSEKVGLRVSKAVSRRGASVVRFYALEGTLCVQIEAESEDDAQQLCRDVRLEFIGLCAR